MKIRNLVTTITFVALMLFFGVSQAVILPQTGAKSEKSKSIQVTQATANRKAFYLRFSAGKKASMLAAVRGLGARVDYQFDRYDTLAISLPEQAVNALSSLPNVKLLEPVPEYKLQAQLVPWNIDQFQARDVWDADRDGIIDNGAPDGSGVKFCIIDTGFWAAHDDFQGITHSGMSQIPGEAYTEDENGHGTHVAGTANAVNNSIGVVGVMPGGAELIIVKIFGNNGLWSSGNSNLGVAVEYCRDQGANVISMSLGGGFSATEDAIFQNVYDNHNILPIAAAGNDGDNAGAEVRSYPASYESVVSVAAVRQSDNVANFSQYPATSHDPLNQPANTEWDVVELSGGGEQVLSTWPGPPAGPNGNVPIIQVTNDGIDYPASQIAETAVGDVTQSLVDGNLCDAGDVDGSWNGSIVLCERGDILFSDKMNNVASIGGLAVVLYNNVAGTLSATCGGNCTSGANIPGVSITQSEGQLLQANGLGLPTRVVVDDGAGCVGCSGGYKTISGTSMATPGVAAGVAWAWDACGGPASITNKQLRQLLRDSARDLSGTHDFSGQVYGAGWDTHTGFGLVQLKDALDLGNQRFGSTCPNADYTIGGTVSGLAGDGLVLQNNGGDDLVISTNGIFTFDTALLDGSSYLVTVLSEPPIPDQNCTVGNASGDLDGENISNVTVSCVTTCKVTTASGMVNITGVSMEACENIIADPSLYVTQNGELNLAAGLGISLGGGFTVEQGGIMNAKVCGQSLCETSVEPMLDGCHSCVTQICVSNPECCLSKFNQACVDKVGSICGLTCN